MMKKHRRAIRKRQEARFESHEKKLELQVIDLKQLVKEKDTALRAALKVIKNLKQMYEAYVK